MGFPFAEDDSRDLTVQLQEISTTFQGASHSLLPQGIYTFIDSTVPRIWLPPAACRQFEQWPGLTMDLHTGLYLVNDTLDQKLLDQDLIFTFTIGNTMSGPPSLDIVLPYASFDLFVDYQQCKIAHDIFLWRERRTIRSIHRVVFSCRRHESISSQRRCGRLQIIRYLTVDYEGSKFYLSQTTFLQNASQHIIAIPSLNSTSSDNTLHHSLPIGAIAGLVVARILAGITLMTCAWIILKTSFLE
ncbi:hypothetical protein BDZ45DRAFT_386951 [Acephala macrosclerotiorum]|nr:hypothetical protein BDZ45DRAFT_386951 [Acephala macrosclerotiorum]